MLKVELPVGHEVLSSAPTLMRNLNVFQPTLHPEDTIMPFARIDLLKGKTAELFAAEQCRAAREDNAYPVHNRLLIRGREKPRHRRGDALPVLGLLFNLLPPVARQRVESGAASGFRDAPFAFYPSTLFQAKEGRIDRPLIETDRVLADLFDSPRYAIAVLRSHRLKRLQHHQIKCSLQYIGFAFRHGCSPVDRQPTD
jgi:hypothetical protein